MLTKAGTLASTACPITSGQKTTPIARPLQRSRTLSLNQKDKHEMNATPQKKLKPWPCKSFYILLPSMPSYCSQRIFPIDLQSRKPRHSNPQKNCTKVLPRFISTTSGPSSKPERYRFGAAKSSSNQITLFAD